jgi:hypothetical protein
MQVREAHWRKRVAAGLALGMAGAIGALAVASAGPVATQGATPSPPSRRGLRQRGATLLRLRTKKAVEPSDHSEKRNVTLNAERPGASCLVAARYAQTAIQQPSS